MEQNKHAVTYTAKCAHPKHTTARALISSLISQSSSYGPEEVYIGVAAGCR